MENNSVAQRSNDLYASEGLTGHPPDRTIFELPEHNFIGGVELTGPVRREETPESTYHTGGAESLDDFQSALQDARGSEDSQGSEEDSQDAQPSAQSCVVLSPYNHQYYEDNTERSLWARLVREDNAGQSLWAQLVRWAGRVLPLKSKPDDRKDLGLTDATGSHHPPLVKVLQSARPALLYTIHQRVDKSKPKSRVLNVATMQAIAVRGLQDHLIWAGSQVMAGRVPLNLPEILHRYCKRVVSTFAPWR